MKPFSNHLQSPLLRQAPLVFFLSAAGLTATAASVDAPEINPKVNPKARTEAGDDAPPELVLSVSRGVTQKAADTAASVSVLSAADIQDGQAKVNASETLVRVPGLVAQNRQNYAQDIQISSRGFGARASFGVRGIRLYADGIPASGPDGQGQVSHFDLNSAERIEVLRGPFSALYGNASGGVISLHTANGGTETVASLDSVAGSDGLRQDNLQLSGTQGALQYRISGTSLRTHGFRDHSAAQRQTANGKLRYSLDADTQLTWVINSVAMPEVQDPLGLSRIEMQSNPRQATANAYTYNTRKAVTQEQMGLVLDHRINREQQLQFTIYHGARATRQYQAIASGAQTAASSPGGVIDLQRQYQGLDARWISKTKLLGAPLQLTVGVAGDQLQEERRGFQNFIGTRLGVQGAQRRDEENTVRSFDQYAQGEWALGERWSLSTGLRHSRVSFSSKDNYVVTGNGDDSGAVAYQNTSPVLGVVHHLNDNSKLYATTGRGFETPTLNELAYRAGGQTGLNFGLQNAKSQQTELGIKTLLHPKWRLNAAYFDARTDNEIAVANNSGGRATYQNVGATQRRGLEAALTGHWASDWHTHWALTQLKAVYGSDFLTCTSSPCATPNTLIRSGNRIPGVADKQLFAELAWKPKALTLWGSSAVDAAVEWRYIGQIAVDDRNSDNAASANVFALRLGMAQRMGAWTVREYARIDNVTAKNYAGSVIVNEANSRFFEPAPGRNYLLGVKASYRF
jgi:iron complex outermembrane recepter protein